MVQKFVIVKKSLEYELHVDGTVIVIPLPHPDFSKETVEVLADAHQAAVRRHLINQDKKDFALRAFEYFDRKGFAIKKLGQIE